MTAKCLYQHFTGSNAWLTPPIQQFIAANDNGTIVDPFAGGGDLLTCFPINLRIGYDVDPALGWPVNDSLQGIAANDNSALCITNPPYLSKTMASRKKIKAASSYFSADPEHDNLYKIAVQRCLDTFSNVVAIIPESFLHTRELKKRLQLVDVCETNLFYSTTQPVLTACWAREESADFDVFKNGKLVGRWSALEAMVPRGSVAGVEVSMCHAGGNVGLKTFDNMAFSKPSPGMAAGGRHHCRILVRGIEVSDRFIEAANDELERLRQGTQDLVLTPFLGNDKHGVRRRRLPLGMAKKIIHAAAAGYAES